CCFARDACADNARRLDVAADPRAARLRASRPRAHAHGRFRAEAGTMSDFDFEGVFDEDYLYFYEEMLTPERTAAEVDQIAELLGPREHVLDCPCGHGLIANVLAERGYRVTGLDASELFLDRARADADARGVDVEYVHGDMRQLPRRETLDGLVNWFTSFGYCDEATIREMLVGFCDALRPGGRLVLETQNPARLFRILLPAVYVRRGDDLMVDIHDMDYETWRMRTERV